MEFDYVIVGGGSAGSVLAARLSEDPDITVCLLEAGGNGKSLLVRAPLGTAALLAGRLKSLNWAFETVPQPGLKGRRGYQPRGRGLGGSSAINAMLYVRGHPSDYDDWAALGCDGWRWSDVLPIFRKSQRFRDGQSTYHGADGPLQVGGQQSAQTVTRAFLDACGQSQIPENSDFNGPNQEGAGLFHVTQFFDGARRGERCSAAAAYLHPVQTRPNLKVITGAHAEKILFDGHRATGVAYRGRGGQQAVSARREVIVSSGAFGSPQLLMLSGIGPADELKRHGIEVRHALSGVGQNLQDHVDFIALWRMSQPGGLELSLRGTAALWRAAMQWRRNGTGLMTTPSAEAGAFLKSSPSLARPDLQLHFVPGMVDDHTRKMHFGPGYSCHVCVLRPFSRGEVGLTNSNPRKRPRIDPKFLSDERDATLLLKGAKIMRQLLSAPSLAPFRKSEIYLDGEVSDDDLMEHIRQRADTIYHPVGTCRMGSGPDAVVNPRLRVCGMEGLRVVDASIMPTLIGGNTNAPTIMIAEKAAEMIRRGS